MALIPCPDCGGKVSSAAPSCIHCGRPMQPASSPLNAPAKEPSDSDSAPQRDSAKRITAGVIGASIALLTLATSTAAGEDGPAIILVSTVGVLLGLAGLWFARRRRTRPWRWFHVVLAGTSGSLVAMILTVAMFNPGDPEVVGFAFGAGLSYGLILSASAALILYALTASGVRSAKPSHR